MKRTSCTHIQKQLPRKHQAANRLVCFVKSAQWLANIFIVCLFICLFFVALGTELLAYQAPLSLIPNPLPPFKILCEGLFVKQGIIKLPRSGAVSCLCNSSTYSYRTEPPGPATGQCEPCIFFFHRNQQLGLCGQCSLKAGYFLLGLWWRLQQSQRS